MHYLWRAVDQESEVLESYVTRTRDKAAALSFMKKALKRHGSPEAITNNRVENSHLPFRRRERAMLRFKQMKSLQKFASVQAHVHNHFNLKRHLLDRATYKTRRSVALAVWQNSWPEACAFSGSCVDRRGCD
jgi:putative transposase